MKLEDFDLKQDPFPIVPDGPVYNWAGRTELREDLEDLVKGARARDIGVTEFGVLWGELGAGKSHALRYLKTWIDGDEANFNAIVIYLARPRVATKLNFHEIQRHIIKDLGRQKVGELCVAVSKLIDKTIEEKAFAAGLGHVQDKSSFEESALQDVPKHDRSMVRLLRRGAKNSGKVFSFLIGEERCDGDEYEDKIDSDFMAAQFLGDFFRVLTSEIRADERVKEAIYLFVDEVEMLFDAKATDSELVYSGIRELINSLPYRFCLLLSYSGATALIEATVPNHLLKRMTVPYIQVPMLEDNEAKEFLASQLNYFRTDGSKWEGSFYPFDEGSIDYILEHSTSLTPRNLFIDCKRVMERAVRRHGVEPGEWITEPITAKVLEGYK